MGVQGGRGRSAKRQIFRKLVSPDTVRSRWTALVIRRLHLGADAPSVDWWIAVCLRRSRTDSDTAVGRCWLQTSHGLRVKFRETGSPQRAPCCVAGGLRGADPPAPRSPLSPLSPLHRADAVVPFAAGGPVVPGAEWLAETVV